MPAGWVLAERRNKERWKAAPTPSVAALHPSGPGALLTGGSKVSFELAQTSLPFTKH